MKPFMDEDFLLTNKTAEKLYHDYAKDMPIFDYHCHLNPKEIKDNKRYRNITEIWLGGDHYKWRAMRSNGVDEKYITGAAPDKEKFIKWAETMPKCIGNPLYHWTHLELKRFFGINELLSPKTAEVIWEKCNEMLAKDEFTARELIKRSNVKVICTTDDPADSLEDHIALAKDKTFDVKVLPAFRPDKSFNIDKAGFVEWIERLSNVVGQDIQTFASLKEALKQRLDFFHEVGCRVSDHALDPIVFEEGTEEEITSILQKALKGEQLTESEIKKYKTEVMVYLGKQYTRLNWTMQIHIGTIRNNSKRMMRLLGPDTGFDAIADYTFAEALSKFLDKLDDTDELPKTILYCLNPRDNEILGTIIGCFQGGGIPGKIQVGSGWWFNDQKDGMTKQIISLSNLGLLSLFVGMLTDSRSFLSYTRHEYFRRILCNIIGEWVESGEAPNDFELLGTMVQNICFDNAKEYFGIKIQ
ncbi:glucuronate isomerase [Pelosinus sp. IPA-1]|uniref:glucuronate isomerase n=1 Tax=Pelosinus sp. IPA-1 TaxID=3029569 RepID=UPI002436245E|nr:glucuronate isomerase [Pelosinus sp. IPA-1]GMA98729.1 uronate isomerase [Pelosinus sp. IPA-1]